MAVDLEPKQQRSRRTLARLLSATTQTLAEHGLEGATIPRIAAVAGVAPASVYRRFRDRDSLIRAAFMDALQQGAAANRRELRLESFKNTTFDGVVNELIESIMKQYTKHSGLLRAFKRFAETDSDELFKRKALSVMMESFGASVDLLVKNFRAEIAHADPKRAVTFGLLNTATIIEVRALAKVSMARKLIPMTDREMRMELKRSLLAYLRTPISTN